MDLTGSFRAKICSYSVVFLSVTIILLDIDPTKLPQSWWWELKLRREGVNTRRQTWAGKSVAVLGAAI